MKHLNFLFNLILCDSFDHFLWGRKGFWVFRFCKDICLNGFLGDAMEFLIFKFAMAVGEEIVSKVLLYFLLP
jgi:hypothetical protein